MLNTTTPMGVPVIGQDGHRYLCHRYLLPDARMPLPRRAYRVRDLIFMLGLPRSTLYDLISKGCLRAVAIGGGRRKLLLVPAEEIEALLNPPRRDPELDEYLHAALPGYAGRRRTGSG